MHGLDAVQAKSTGRRRKAYSARTARFIAEHGLTAYRAEQARRKRKSLLRKLGLTQERLDAIKEKQGGRCAICLNIPEPTPRQLIAPVPGLVIDHDHDTGRFRGLICIKCNAGIGMFLDDPERLRRAIGYLEAAKQ